MGAVAPMGRSYSLLWTKKGGPKTALARFVANRFRSEIEANAETNLVYRF